MEAALHRRRRPGALALRALVALALVTGAGQAAADQQGAAELFKAARAAYARREYRAAAVAFEAAHREAPHAATIYNAALAWETAGEGARAATAFARALATREELDKGQARDAEVRLTRLERSLGRIEVEAPAGAAVTAGHVERAAAPVTIYVAPGEHQVTVTFADGGESARAARVAAGERAQLAFEAPILAAEAKEPEQEGAPAPTRAPAVEAGDARGGSGLRTAGWIALGGAAALGGVAAILGMNALAARDEFNASGYTDAAAHDRAASLRTWTNVALVGAGVAAAAGITLLVIPTGAPAQAQVQVAPTALVVRGQF